MATDLFKQKTKQYIINSARQPVYTIRNDVVLFNLNSCFVKQNNYARFETLIRESLSHGCKKINLGNLAALCYKLDMDYCSKETLEFVRIIVTIIKQHKVELVQNNIRSYGEVDMQPIDNLISYDEVNNIVYINSVLVECLKILGYVDSQIRDIITVTKDFRKIIPLDLIAELPIANSRTLKAYEKIKEVLK
jgi:hypothetical protein